MKVLAVSGSLRAGSYNTRLLRAATPEYNGSIPGGLKNAVDWASRPRGEAALANKTVAVVGASTGQFGAMWAQQDLRKVLGLAGARVVGEELPVARADQGFDENVHERLRDVLESLVLAADPVAAAA